jgi:uncharacterized protein DUF4388/GAF domain-containing protein
MSLSGQLSDVSVVDILQFINLGRRNGSLFLWEGVRKAALTFQSGKIAYVWNGQQARLSELVTRAGLVNHVAIDQLRSKHPDGILAELLVARGFVTREALSKAIEAHVARVVRELVGWTNGTFEFTDEARVIESVGSVDFDILPPIELNTEFAVLEAVRGLDELKGSGFESPTKDLVEEAFQEFSEALSTSAKKPLPPPSPAPSSVGRKPSFTEVGLTEADHERIDLALQLASAEQEVARLSKLYVAAYQLHASLDPSEVESTIKEILANMLGAESFALIFRSRTGKNHEVVMSAGRSGRFESMCTGASYNGGDLLIDSTLEDGILRLEPRADSAALAVIPLNVQCRRAGVLALFKFFDHKRGLVPEDRELLELLAAHAASALCAARVYSSTSRKLRTLEGLVDMIRSESFDGRAAREERLDH